MIGVKDHYRIEDSRNLIAAAREVGLFAFSGFEAVTKDGVHFLCLFVPHKDDHLERFIGECGIHDSSQLSPTGNLDCTEDICWKRSKNWGAASIAAHVASIKVAYSINSQDNSSSSMLGNRRICLHARFRMRNPVQDAPVDVRPILQNKNTEHKRTYEFCHHQRLEM